jgi:hypothetical protein
MTRLITIVGTDLTGPQEWWKTHYPEENPPIDDTHHFDRMHGPSMEHQYLEIADWAQFDGIAVGLRDWQNDASTHMRILRASIRETLRAVKKRPAPTILPWFDTGAITDYHNYGVPEGQETPFDFANPAHVAGVWPNTFGPFFETFSEGGPYANPIQWERTPDGRVLIAAWGINPMGHGVINQQYAQRLLDDITTQMAKKHYGAPAFLLDTSWRERAPNITPYAEHGWFDGAGTPYTIRTFKGVTAGVLVAGFQDPWNAPKPWRRIDRRGGKTYSIGLKAMRDAKADIVLYESYNNRVEGAGLYSNATWGTTYLDLTRAFQETNAPAPIEPIPPHPEPIPGGHMRLAVTTEPLLQWKTGVLVPSGISADRYGMRWTQPTDTTKAGYPDPTSKKFLCLNPDGRTEAKDTIGDWEASQPIGADDVEIRWFTINAGGDQSATLVYGLQQFAE